MEVKTTKGKIIDNITSQTTLDKLGNALPNPNNTREK